MREEARYEDVAGEAAIDGTGSHLLLEMCLNENQPAAHFDQRIIGANHHDSPNGWLVGVERIKRVQMCLDYVARRVNELQAARPAAYVHVQAEMRTDPGGAFGRDDWWGTCDITLTVRDVKADTVLFIEVIDYKDGRGYVGVNDNTQLLSYLFGEMRPYIASGPDQVRPFHPHKVRGCRMTVVQPKTNPVVRYQCSTRPDDNFNATKVTQRAEELATAAHATDADDAPLTPGKHCQWCKANPKRGGHCSAGAEQSLTTVENMSTEVIATDQSAFEYIGQMIADPATLTCDQLGELAGAEAALQAAFDNVKKEIQQRIEQGDQVPGWAMLPGNSSRIWVQDEEATIKMLKARRVKKDEYYPQKLISVAAVMKLESLSDDQKATIERDYVAVKEGKVSLRKVSHDHQKKVEKDVAQSSTVDMMFAEVPAAAVPAEISFL